VLSELRHPRVLILMGVCRDMAPGDGGESGLVTEFMERGSLFHILQQQRVGGAAASAGRADSFNVTKLRTRLMLAVDIADGMRFLHESGVVHRDLKSANVLVSMDGRAKIADFGLSSFKQDSTHVTGVVGTFAWSSPEALNEEEFIRPSTDVYSFGVVLWEIFSGLSPWDGKSMAQIVLAVASGKRLTIPSLSENVPENIRTMIQSCFVDAVHRPTFNNIFDELRETLQRQKKHHDVPDSFVCPISLELMRDPVICSDGHSYERASIEEWFRSSNRSPKTNIDLPNRILIPNYALKASIEGLRHSSK
jgi:serine/threonine protein kinase